MQIALHVPSFLLVQSEQVLNNRQARQEQAAAAFSPSEIALQYVKKLQLTKSSLLNPADPSTETFRNHTDRLKTLAEQLVVAIGGDAGQERLAAIALDKELALAPNEFLKALGITREQLPKTDDSIRQPIIRELGTLGNARAALAEKYKFTAAEQGKADITQNKAVNFVLHSLAVVGLFFVSRSTAIEYAQDQGVTAALKGAVAGLGAVLKKFISNEQTEKPTAVKTELSDTQYAKIARATAELGYKPTAALAQ